MELTTKHYGGHGYNPSSIIELTANYEGNMIVVTVTDLKGNVDENLIENLRHIANELEEQNALVLEKSKQQS